MTREALIEELQRLIYLERVLKIRMNMALDRLGDSKARAALKRAWEYHLLWKDGYLGGTSDFFVNKTNAVHRVGWITDEEATKLLLLHDRVMSCMDSQESVIDELENVVVTCEF